MVQFNHTQEISFRRWNVCFYLAYPYSVISLYLTQNKQKKIVGWKKEKIWGEKTETVLLPRFQLTEFGERFAPLNWPRVMRTTYVKVQISFLILPSLNIWNVLGGKRGSEFDVSSAIEQSSCCFDVAAWCVLSGLHLPMVLIIQFVLSLGHMCSSRFSFVQTDFLWPKSQVLPLTVSFQFCKGDIIFLFIRTSSPFFFPVGRNRGKLFYLQNVFLMF